MGTGLSSMTTVLSALVLASLVSVSISASIYDYDGTIRYSSYSDHVARMKALARDYPQLVKLTTAQKKFGLPSVGKCGAGGCETYILTLTNHTSFRKARGRSEVLISGEIHGDERVGPASVLAFVEFVCHERETNSWLDFLVNNRIVTVVPMLNAIGYEKNVREEVQYGNTSKVGVNGEAALGAETEFDANRDFAFDQDPQKCMRTLAARTLNELFRARIFSILLTFHAGTNALGYEWGDKTHCDATKCSRAPDYTLMGALAARMSEYAGPAGKYEEKYPVGNMGELIYPVVGGMEDWAYGASWSPAAVKCKPKTLGGYAASKTDYPFESNRCVTYLVETSINKNPKEETLGSLEGIKKMSGGGDEDGHVPRNVRLILGAVDSVEPYVSILGARKKSEDTAIVSWRVGGSFYVDGTHLQHGTLKKHERKRGFGKTYEGKVALPTPSFEKFVGSRFRQSVQVGKDPVFVRAAAIVDSDFTGRSNRSRYKKRPVSHLANSRWDSGWSYSSKESRIIGKSMWYSDAYRLTMVDGKLQLEPEHEYRWGRDIEGFPADIIFKALSGTKNLGGPGKLLEGSPGGLGDLLEQHSGPAIGGVGIICGLLIAAACLWGKKRRRPKALEIDQRETDPLYEIGSEEDIESG